ncbi:MAG: DUF3617 domain-containing protein [Bacteriovoracaceae bacterium]|nr:DUF3617 domain-containing protein [Bacteriovoracaceae bacterium]
MKFIALFSCIFIFANAHAKLDMKPGLWEVTGKLNVGGLEVDPSAMAKTLMAKMNAEQKKKAEEALKKVAGGQSKGLMDGEGYKMCYTKELLEKDHNIAKMKNDKCKQTNVVRKDNTISLDFTCEDGTKGKGKWTLKNQESYTGEAEVTLKDGKSGKMKFDGKFKSADCGDIKPIKVDKK